MDSLTITWDVKVWHKFHDGSEPFLPRGFYFYVETRMDGKWRDCIRYGPLEPEMVDFAAPELRARFGRTDQEIEAFKRQLLELNKGVNE